MGLWACPHKKKKKNWLSQELLRTHKKSSSCHTFLGKLYMQEDNKQLVFGAEKSISHYNKLKHNLTLLTSALHQFWLDIRWVSNKKEGGNFRHGWWIAVQAIAAGRRKGLSRGKAKVTLGKPLGLLKGQPPAKKQLDSWYILPTWWETKGKRKHSLKLSMHRKGASESHEWWKPLHHMHQSRKLLKSYNIFVTVYLSLLMLTLRGASVLPKIHNAILKCSFHTVNNRVFGLHF